MRDPTGEPKTYVFLAESVRVLDKVSPHSDVHVPVYLDSTAADADSTTALGSGVGATTVGAELSPPPQPAKAVNTSKPSNFPDAVVIFILILTPINFIPT